MSSSRLAVLTAALLVAAQCAFGQTASSGSHAHASPAATITLSEAIKAAQAGGTSFKLARDTLASARAQRDQAVAANGLSLSGTGAYSHQDNLPGVSVPLTTPTNLLSAGAAAQSAIGELSTNPVGENYQAGAVLSGPSTSLSLAGQHLSESGSPQDQVSALTLAAKQTLFDGYPGGRGSGELEEAKRAFQVARLSYEEQLLSLILQVKRSYYTLLGGQQVVEVEKVNVQQARQDLSRVEGLVAANEATHLDLLQARVALGKAQVALGTAEDQLVIERKNLSLEVGWPLDKVYRAAAAPAPGARTLDMAKALRIALANRSELRQLDAQIASARVALGLAKSRYVPVLSATGGITVEHDWSANYTMGTFNAGLSVALPIYKNGLLAAQVREARAQLDSLEQRHRQEVQSIEIAVQNAIFNVVQDEKSLEVSHQSVDAAEGQYSLEKEKRAAGIATNLDVLQAASALAQAKSTLQKASNSYDLAVLDLNNTLGLP